MDALKEYESSDESNESPLPSKIEELPRNVKTKTKKANETFDYFGLENDKSYEKRFEGMAKDHLEDIRKSFKLQTESSMLHNSDYGPNRSVPEDFSSRNEITFSNVGIKRTTKLNNEKPIKVPKVSVPSPVIKTGEQLSLLQEHPKITSLIGTECKSKLPSHIANEIVAHTNCVSSLCWAPSQYSHLLLTASLDSKIKIWNLFSADCKKTFNHHTKGVKAAVWSLCGKKIFSGGYDCKAFLLDANTGQKLNTYTHNDFVTSVQVHPENENILFSGIRDCITAWDARMSVEQKIRSFSSNFGEVLDLAFLFAGREIICSTDFVSRDSADRTIIAWDFDTGALLSNQIYQERYTCPCLKVDPAGTSFIAQTNGNYIAIFSSKRPYRMNKNKRYEGHKVAGYSIRCDFSPDGSFVASGDAEGGIYIYDADSTKLMKKLNCTDSIPTVNVNWHPVLFSTIAVGTWMGKIQFWK